MLHPHDRFGDAQHLFGGNEILHRLGEKRLRPKAPSGQYAEARDAVFQMGVEGDVVNWPLHAVVAAARKGNLELAGEREIQRVEEKVFVQREGIGNHIERLPGEQARVVATGDVPDAIRTRPASGNANGQKPFVHRDHVLQCHPVQLDVLPGRDMHHSARILFGDICDRSRLLGRHHSRRQFDPLHVAGVVQLVVQAITQPNGPELVVVQFACLVASYSRGVCRQRSLVHLLCGSHDQLLRGQPYHWQNANVAKYGLQIKNLD